eukprot:scaffold508003_cov41-Prasinocladus_malaysianus.AAC.1
MESHGTSKGHVHNQSVYIKAREPGQSSLETIVGFGIAAVGLSCYLNMVFLSDLCVKLRAHSAGRKALSATDCSGTRKPGMMR